MYQWWKGNLFAVVPCKCEDMICTVEHGYDKHSSSILYSGLIRMFHFVYHVNSRSLCKICCSGNAKEEPHISRTLGTVCQSSLAICDC